VLVPFCDQFNHTCFPAQRCTIIRREAMRLEERARDEKNEIGASFDWRLGAAAAPTAAATTAPTAAAAATATTAAAAAAAANTKVYYTMVAERDVQEGEELLVSYGEQVAHAACCMLHTHTAYCWCRMVNR
jgi:hypothetical protein